MFQSFLSGLINIFNWNMFLEQKHIKNIYNNENDIFKSIKAVEGDLYRSYEKLKKEYERK